MRHGHHVVMFKGECDKYKSMNITKYIHDCGRDSSISGRFMFHPMNLEDSFGEP